MLINEQECQNPMKLARNVSSFQFFSKMTILYTTLASIVCLLFREYHKMNWCNKFINNQPEDPNHIYFMYDDVIDDIK